MKTAALILIVALAGCASPRTVWRDRTVEVKVPVPAACTTPRPVAVPLLKQRIGDAEWRALDVRQKAAAMARHALDLRNHGEALHAATAGCE